MEQTYLKIGDLLEVTVPREPRVEKYTVDRLLTTIDSCKRTIMLTNLEIKRLELCLLAAKALAVPGAEVLPPPVYVAPTIL